jgi:hypothetical protein
LPNDLQQAQGNHIIPFYGINIAREAAKCIDERQPLTAAKKNWRFCASYDSFVVQQIVVLRIKICGKKRPLRQAPNRCV